MEERVDSRPKCLFRRKLPIPPAIAAFDSAKGEQLFQKGLLAGTMKCYFSLAQQYRTQEEPAFCGISTLVMTLNSLNIDSGRIWKGPWRWFHEDMLSCCTPLEEVKESGISLQEWICLAKCNGAAVRKFLPGGGELDEFRALVKSCSKTPSSERALIVSYSRKHFDQTGDGHFSPIGGYCEEEDAVLILDVARFKYPAHWVKVEDLWKSMSYLDPTTGKPRGCVVLEPSALSSSIIFTFRTRPSDWDKLSSFLEKLGSLSQKNMPAVRICSGNACDEKSCFKNVSKTSLTREERAVFCFFHCLPDELFEILKSYEDEYSFQSLPIRPRDHELAMQQIKEEIRDMESFQMVKGALHELGYSSQNPLLAWALFMAVPGSLFSGPDKDVYAELQDLSQASDLLKEEILCLKRQIMVMMDKDVDVQVPCRKSGTCSVVSGK